MHTLVTLIEQFGLAIVFANVLIEQLGAPVPAYPTMIVAGAMLGRVDQSAAALLAATIAAALLADLAWYWGGKHHGRKALAMLCRISLSPDSCVRQTESFYTRWGAASLVVAKFIPGFSTVGNALAGTLGTPLRTFILFNALGTGLWAGSAILIGNAFSTAIDDLLQVMEVLGKAGGLLLVAGLGGYVLAKWWQRERFLRSLRMARISVHELYELRQDGKAPVVIDVRSAVAHELGRIPGAIAITGDDLESYSPELPLEAEIILYCACPNEASAAIVARQLMRKGFRHVRPLAGGIEAWVAAGYGLELQGVE